MRKEYGKVLRPYFSKKMIEAAPDFKETKVNSAYLWPGERAFCRSEGDSIKCWIVLSPNPKGYDDFTVMIGWSTVGRYPELNVTPSMITPSSDRKEFEQEEYLIRLPQLWTNDDRWWVVKGFEPSFSLEELEQSMSPISTDDAKSSVIPLVNDAIQKIIDVGIPYLTEFVNAKLAKMADLPSSPAR